MLKRWLLLASAIVLIPGSASAASNDMFRGKTITYIVATTAGGGYDTYGRMIARYMPKYLPGSRVIVRNVPGAGNIIGANAIYTARPDGTTIGMFNTGLIYNQLIGSAGMNFDIAKFTWLGKAATEARAVVLSTNSGIKSFDDMLKARDVKFATSGIGTASYFDAHPGRCAQAQHPGGRQLLRQHRRAQHAERRSRRADWHGGVARAVRKGRRRVLCAGDFRQGRNAPRRPARRAIRQGRAREEAVALVQAMSELDGFRRHRLAFRPKLSRSCARRWSRRSRMPASSPF